MRAKNITARQFAEEIGIQPSGMSHILGGRNNPSLDFAVKVLKRYPEIDANWLLLGKGAMYGEGESLSSEPTAHQSAEPMPQQEVKGETYAESKVEDYQATYVAVPPQEVERKEVVEDDELLDEESQPVRMLLIYSDNTYEVLTPRC